MCNCLKLGQEQFSFFASINLLHRCYSRSNFPSGVVVVKVKGAFFQLSTQSSEIQFTLGANTIWFHRFMCSAGIRQDKNRKHDYKLFSTYTRDCLQTCILLQSINIQRFCFNIMYFCLFLPYNLTFAGIFMLVCEKG
jgi:hypothetical protein